MVLGTTVNGPRSFDYCPWESTYCRKDRTLRCGSRWISVKAILSVFASSQQISKGDKACVGTQETQNLDESSRCIFAPGRYALRPSIMMPRAAMPYHNEENIDEPDPVCEIDDAKTIQMDSPEFWNAVRNFDLPDIPDSVKLSESTSPTTFIKYTACRAFDITRLDQDSESSTRQSENGSDDSSVIVESEFLTYEAFESLQDSHKMRYFDKLTAASTSWAFFEKSCPRLDKFVFQHYDNNNYLSRDEFGLCLQHNIKQRWSLGEAPLSDSASRHENGRMGSLVSWYDDDLRWNSANMRYELKPYRFPPIHLPMEKVISECRLRGFLHHISSSLLLYRLTILTGELMETTDCQTGCPWDMTDGYKSSWDLPLRHIDSVSTLRFYDYKGQARAFFCGSEEAQNDAMELINLLTSRSFPHTYDGIMAGTVA
ncbi:unnamed protein product [Penicillium manginii]